MAHIQIGEKRIEREGNNVLIVVEVGSNYDCDMNKARKMIDIIAESGADAVKFQTFKAEKLVTKKTPKCEYQKTSQNDESSCFSMLVKLEMTEDEHKELKEYTEKKGLVFLSTPHSQEWSVDFLEKLGICAYKIGSGDMNNLPFLEYISGKKKPMIVATGMSTLEEAKETYAFLKQRKVEFALLHATSSYPCRFEDANLKAVYTLLKEFPDVVIGFSDHTPGIESSLAAVGIGARIIEKHFTLDRNSKGPSPDHNASIEPNELKELVIKIRNLEKALGSGIKKPAAIEMDVAKVARKSVIALKDIKKGEIFSKDNLEIKRPGTGLPPKTYYSILGKKASRGIEKEELIKDGDFR